MIEPNLDASDPISWPAAISFRRRLALRWNCSAWRGCLRRSAGCGVRGSGRRLAGVVESIAGGLDTDVLRIATTWPRPEREQLEREFREQTSPGRYPSGWSGSSSLPGRGWTIRSRGLSRWTCCSVAHSPSMSVFPVPGGSSRWTARSRPDWLVARRQQIALIDGLSRGADQAAFDDPPRRSADLDLGGRAIAKQSSWQAGYARLVLLYSRALPRPGWQSGSAAAAVDRGEAACYSPDHDLPDSPGGSELDPSARPLERGRGHPARKLARSPGAGVSPLSGRSSWSHAGPGKPRARPRSERSAGRSARAPRWLMPRKSCSPPPAPWSARQDRQSAQARDWLTEPPPWPPASVEKLQSRGGESALALVQDLAGQIAPDPEPRFWLVQSWLRPARPIDRALLTELAQAAGGRLVREPRFRAWLRGEWTAWARQRYRRVARLVAGAGSAAGAAPPGCSSASRPILNQGEGRPLHDSRHCRRAGQAVRAGRRGRWRGARDRTRRALLLARPLGCGKNRPGPPGCGA